MSLSNCMGGREGMRERGIVVSYVLGTSLTVYPLVRILEEAYEDLGDTLAVQYVVY